MAWLALVGAVALCGCDDKASAGSADPSSAKADSEKQNGSEKAEDVAMGGELELADWSFNDKKPLKMKIGKAFAYVVTDEDTDDEGKPKQVFKLAEIAIYNDGAKDVTCETKMSDFKDKKLMPGSHYGVLLSGRNFLALNFGKQMEVGDDYGPCPFWPADFGNGTEQRMGCGYSSVVMSNEDVKLTFISKTKIEGTISVESSTHGTPNYIRGKFIAKVCPIVTLEKFLQ